MVNYIEYLDPEVFKASLKPVAREPWNKTAYLEAQFPKP